MTDLSPRPGPSPRPRPGPTPPGLALRGLCAAAVLALPLAAQAITTYGSPHQYEVAPPGTSGWDLFDGVASLTLWDAQGQARTCSGSVLWTGGHLLTAGHCLYNTYQGVFDAVGATIALPGHGVVSSMAVDRSMAHGEWTGDVNDGYDLAILPLPTAVPWGFHIDRSGAGMFNLGTDDPPFQLMAGYGISGAGAMDSTVYPHGTLRAGVNQYDALWTDVPGQPYMFDFDDYGSAHNAVGLQGVGWIPGYGEHWVEIDWDFSGDPVRGEVMIAPGDSGGPSFLDNLLVGVHSFFSSSTVDADGLTNASFGELGADTRVFVHADWIDARVAAPVPEPGTALMFALGLIGLVRLGASRR